MTLHLTKKLADKLKLAPEPQTDADALYSWRANYIQEHGYRFVVFMNDASRFMVVINEAKVAKLKKLPELFVQTLRESMLAFSVNPEVIERYFAEAGELSYARNADRKMTAQLNKSTDSAWGSLRNYSEDVDLSVCASAAAIFGADETYKPKDKFLGLLERYGLPVRKSRALDLNVRLYLDGKDALRKLRVPASLSFEKLHKLLQAAFGWANCHLYSFGLFAKWPEEYEDQPVVELVVESDQYDAYEANPNAKSIAGVKLSDYVPEYTKIVYLYDFGDNWLHFIEVERVFEDCAEELPVLLSGAGDAPPEDVGGTGGYAEFLEIMADPAHEDYEEMTEWAKSQWWKPFDLEVVKRRVRRL
ncbi:MAG: plasmid pRiA4b ORF-3 family protein [Oscillospiraceae bacterium]|jgi:hypothetical protein|nr:plasmid pRiA4b ORF-3 family protein [Oscillospiraceae bacterium]